MQAGEEHRPQRANGRGRLVTKPFRAETRLDGLFQEGCAKIRLPQSFDGRMEAVLINTAGGLTGGDRLAWDFETGAATHLTVTTQACERVYRAVAGTAEVTTRLIVGDGARADWLPQETILFDRSSLTRRLDVDLAPDAEFLAVEAILFGRKAMGEQMETGLFRDRWRIRRAGRLIHAEETRFSGKVAEIALQRAVLAGDRAYATVLFCSRMAEGMLEPLRRLLGDATAGASVWNDKLVLRIAASDGFSLRKILMPVISCLRNGASVPKVWTL